MLPSKIEEAGCACCAQLCLKTKMSPIQKIKNYLDILDVDGVTRKYRESSKDPLESIKGPVLVPNCDLICNACRAQLRIGKVPNNALATGLWLGEVPDVLKNLNYLEQILVSRLRHNTNFIKVNATSYRKMVAHCVSWENPMPELY
ncbi:hypothetical protein BDZ89DRAFT_954575, partial [Hymenopellis radicata]